MIINKDKSPRFSITISTAPNNGFTEIWISSTCYWCRCISNVTEEITANDHFGHH